MADLSRSIDPELLFAQTDWLRALARSIVRDAEAAEDVVQDTLVAALEQDGERAPRGVKLKAWLATVAANFARRRVRAGEVRRFHERNLASERSEIGATEEELELVRLQRLLSERVLDLREPYRTAVVLRFQQGLSYGAMARRLRVTTAAARKRVSRGLALLREDIQRREGLSGLGLLALFGNGKQGPLASTITLGGMTMGAKNVWIGVAATGVLLLGWSQLRQGNAVPQPGLEAEAQSTPVSLVASEVEPEIEMEEESEGSRAVVHVPAASEPEAPTVAAELLIQGRVLDEGGNPVLGAVVALARDPLHAFTVLDVERRRTPRSVAEVRSSEDGSFQFEVPRGIAYEVTASSPGLGRSHGTTAYAGEELELVLIPPACLVVRVEREDGSVVPDARVEAILLPSRQPAFSGRTDENGSVTFADLEAGKVQAKVVPRAESMLWGQQITLTAGQVREHVFVVEPGPTIVGRITDAGTGQPIEGAVVGQGYTYEKVAHTDTAGRYELEGFANLGVYAVYARAPGYGQGHVALPDSFTPRMTADIALHASVRASGRVVDVDGEPVVEAYVAAALDSSGWASTRTDEGGAFRLDGLEPDRPHSLFVVAKGFGTCAFEFPRPLLVRGEYVLGDVVLERGSLVSGRIVDLSGRPLAGVEIHITGRYEARFALSGPLPETVADSYVAEREGRTDTQGRFAFGDLAPGTYTVGAGPSGQTFARSEDIVVPAESAIEDLEIILDAGWDIEGSVVDEAGEPLAGIVITLFPEPPTEGRMAQMFTGEDGRFAESGFALGTYRVEIDSTQLRSDHATRPLASQSLRDFDPFGAPMRIVMKEE